MADIIKKYNPNKIPERLKKTRRDRAKQYKNAKKFFDDISNHYSKNSQEYKNAETYFNQYKSFKTCTSQEALAEAIHVKRQTIIEWEKGARYPSIQNLILLCSEFKCNMDYLIGFVETPITEPVSIAHYFSNIDSSIIKYGLENEDYLRCLNFFMLPENCADLFNEFTISAWRDYIKKSAIEDIQSPLKEDVIKAYNEYSAITPIQNISKSTYKSFLKKKFPEHKIALTKTPTANGYIIKNCFNRITYQNFYEGKEFNYSSFINYLVEHTFKQLSQNALIESKKNILAKKFIELFEKYLNE